MTEPVLIAGLIGLAGGASIAAPVAVLWSLRRLRTQVDAVARGGADADRLSPPVAALVQAHRDELEGVRREATLGRRITEERAARADRVLDALDDAIIVLDETGIVLERNAAAASLGGGPHHPDARGLDATLPSPTAVREILDLARGLAAAEVGAFRSTDLTLVSEDATRDFHAVIRRLDDTGRTLLVLHETTHDRELARLQSEFVAKASHELRTPLSSIHATLEMFEEGDLDDPEARAEMLGIATEETDRLARLVDDMLDISRIEAGVARPTIEQVDLGRLAIEAVEGVRAAAEQRDLRLETRVAGDGLVVEGDRGMLATVIGNLVGNAVKYVPDGERITVEVAPEDLTRSVVVTVTDTGLGIPPEDLPQVFEKFYRVRRYERRARGTGLGLDLCRNIVEQVHRGRIGVDSTLGEGARFWFGVPALHASSVAA